jgi:2-oxoglutarate dehydrogenase E1 component|tara:strand:- start:4212 stop:7157 length:2946 start_codon:yes stop_codon:yes gene_type:complete
MSAAPRPVVPAVNQWSAEYLEEQYKLFERDPSALPAELRAFFQGFQLAQAGDLRLFGRNGAVKASQAPAPSGGRQADPGSGTPRITPTVGRPAGRASPFEAVVDDLIGAYRDQGHLCAKIDPFGRERPRPEALNLDYHNVSERELARVVDGTGMGLGESVSVRELVEHLESMYCGTIGVEFMHVSDLAQRSWLIERYETAGGRVGLSPRDRVEILEHLTKSETFERFLQKRYPGDKRFSLEGAESLIPLLQRVIVAASNLGTEELVLGMAHRGRLNVLNNVLGKTYEQIFTEFEENWTEGFADGSGDVKYHRGYSGTRRLEDGRMVHLALASNPSHLEAVNGIVQGRCRAKQRLRGDKQRTRVIPVLIHGDAAVAGQGVVQEVLNYSQLEGYTTGGTIHVVVNNQIGFTTLPEDARSSRYCTDIGKSIDAPIFHVNGEDPEAVVAVAQMAAEFRQKFKRDVFIDLVCYRKYGHNEQDEASFTQPLMAATIKNKPSVLDVYTDRLQNDGTINEADRLAIQSRLDEALEKAQQAARNQPNDPTIDPGSARWSGQTHSFTFDPGETAVSIDAIREVASAVGRVPEGFRLNPKLKKLFKDRSELAEAEMISYADAEQLAFGTLLVEGHSIRLSGQDCRRGTFSHRHAVVRDFETAEPYTPLNNIREVGDEGTDRVPGSEGADGKPRQARFCVYDSPLSEYGVMAFDYGYSLGDPNMLVCWEAQFGDFVNGAQVIIDQFVASAETKWERWSGLVLLLPHGYEGAGPEHSSARMERFLKLCGNDNMQVVYPTTGAQCFHMFRRQLKRNFRKPLIVMTPKSMLRVPTSPISDLTGGRFLEFIDDPKFAGKAKDAVKRVIVCCGKVYYDLDERRNALGRDDVAIVRMEQIYPFHAEMIRDLLASYPDDAELVYVQEEPYNAAAYLFFADRVMSLLGRERPHFIGRPSSGSPATGSKNQHKYEQENIISKAIGPKPEEKPEQRQVAAAGA